MNETVISIKDFTKNYDGFKAVDNISLKVTRGEIFGLLGPNGAGKTTTLECLEGLRQFDDGQMRIMDVDPQRDPGKLRNLIGVQLQTSALPANMTVEEAMKFFSAYHNVPPQYELLSRMSLDDKRKLTHDPPVLILDEPTAGLDVASRTELHSLMQELKAQGSTLILATHDMAEAEKMTDRVAILLHGKIIATGSPRELTSKGSGMTKVSVRTEDSLLHQHDETFPAVSQQAVKEEYTIFFSTDPGPTVSAILEFIANHDDKLIDLRVERPSLEERFLEITTAGGPQ
jgi:ABC-2 type transport system ATP-binding protein